MNHHDLPLKQDICADVSTLSQGHDHNDDYHCAASVPIEIPHTVALQAGICWKPLSPKLYTRLLLQKRRYLLLAPLTPKPRTVLYNPETQHLCKNQAGLQCPLRVQEPAHCCRIPAQNTAKTSPCTPKLYVSLYSPTRTGHSQPPT